MTVRRRWSPHICQSGLMAVGVGRPPATRGTRFWRTLTTLGVIRTVVPHKPTVTLPSK